MSVIRIISAFVSLLILAACSSHPAVAITGLPAPTDAPAGEIVPTTQRPFHAVNTPSETAATLETCNPGSDEPTTQHTVAADINYSAHTVGVQQQVRYINRTGETLDHIVFNVEPNHLSDTFTLKRAASGPDELDYDSSGKRLTINLPEALNPGCEINVTLQFRLDVPLIGDRVYAYKGYFGYTERQLNLSHWLPTVAVRRDADWITRETVLVGEQEVLDPADWHVTVNLIAPSDNITIAAPGTITQIDTTSWRYFHPHSRDFSLSLSNGYNVFRRESNTGVTVEIYALDETPLAAADHALEVATRSLEMYTDLFSPYPYERLVIVEGDFPDGMELSGMAFVSAAWFSRYPGGPASYLTLITAHEVSHQWWYASVGNDPALDPWLDEALATYSEYIFLEEFYPELRDWWWDFRVGQYNPEGYVDSTVYEFSTIRDYINTVYLRGAQMLHALRSDLGTEGFFQLLRDYAQMGDGQVVTPQFFWTLMTSEQIARTQTTRERFFRQPYFVTSGGS